MTEGLLTRSQVALGNEAKGRKMKIQLHQNLFFSLSASSPQGFENA
jgi:hypothetical protein